MIRGLAYVPRIDSSRERLCSAIERHVSESLDDELGWRKLVDNRLGYRLHNEQTIEEREGEKRRQKAERMSLYKWMELGQADSMNSTASIRAKLAKQTLNSHCKSTSGCATARVGDIDTHGCDTQGEIGAVWDGIGDGHIGFINQVSYYRRLPCDWPTCTRAQCIS